ncbi:hypothetical protein H7J49_27880 [Mycobacterium branderi]|nr:hypothetical protein [Mycobacterium branderi]
MMLIPDVVGEVGEGWDRLRAACLEAVRQLNVPVYDGKHAPAADAPHLVVIVGGDDTTRSFDPSGAYGSLLSNGIYWEYGWGSDSEDAQPLPLSLTLGYWLLLTAKPAGMIVADIAFQAIDFDASPQECVALGQDLAGRAERVAMLVMGEGSTCMTASGREWWGKRARLCDTKVLRALEQADADALARLDPTEFLQTATGRAAWQVLGGAGSGQRFHGRLHGDTAVSGLGYFVASWAQRSDVR